MKKDMPDFIANVAVVDGDTPAAWRIFDCDFGDIVKKLGDISVISGSHIRSKKIKVSILMDDVAEWTASSGRTVTGFIVDGELMFRYQLDAANPVLARLEHALRILREDEAAYYRHFGLRIWVMHRDPTDYRSRNQSIVKSVRTILELPINALGIQAVKSLAVAEVELRGLADELADKEPFVFLKA